MKKNGLLILPLINFFFLFFLSCSPYRLFEFNGNAGAPLPFFIDPSERLDNFDSLERFEWDERAERLDRLDLTDCFDKSEAILRDVFNWSIFEPIIVNQNLKRTEDETISQGFL